MTPTKNINFRGHNIPDSISYKNIGMLHDGFIGKTKVRLAKGGEAILNVFKENRGDGIENYKIMNSYNELIGEMDMVIRKINNYDMWGEQLDSSHVFVDKLRNYSAPNTPYYTKGLTQHKDIGTRLLQIAQRRSDESLCNGNIKLISKGESKNWYLSVIGMRAEYPQEQQTRFKFTIHNPNQLYLPPWAKENLSKIQGGL